MVELYETVSRMYQAVHKYLVGSGGEPNILGKLLKMLFIIIFARLIVGIIFKFVDGSSKLGNKLSLKNERRAETLRKTTKNILRALIYFYATMMVLETFNIDTRSILATAGIGGLAIGFGAQSLVKDILSGFFILQEDSFVVGDYVQIKGMEGVVEDMTLRVTKIRDFDGDLHIIPNGEVQVITNRSRGALRAYVHHTVAYEENIDQAIEVLTDVCNNINEQFRESVKRKVKIDGVEVLTDVGVEIRITGMIEGTHNRWDVERAIRKQGKEALERANIEIPYPRLVTFGREE